MKGFVTAMLFVTSLISFGQNWNVGQPVNMLLSDLQLSSDNCWNQGMQADDVIYFPNSLVDGVQHGYVINSASPGVGFGVPNNTVSAGDTVWITQAQQQFEIYFTGGTGGALNLSVIAFGTPTMPGQAHPCAASNLWFGNLLICGTGYNNNIQTGCSTQTSTGVAETQPLSRITLPSSSNGFQLQVHSELEMTYRIYGVTGALVAEGAQEIAHGVSCNDFVDGVYFYAIQEGENVRTGKFVLTH